MAGGGLRRKRLGRPRRSGRQNSDAGGLANHVPATGLSTLESRFEFDDVKLMEHQERIRFHDVLQKAQALQKEGKTEEAIDTALASLDTLTQDQSLYGLYTYVGSLYFAIQKYHQAAEYMTRATEHGKLEPGLACNLAAALMSIDRLEEALEHLEGIQLSLIQNSRRLMFSVLFNLSCVHSLMENSEESMKNLKLSATIDPASTLASLGDTQLDNVRKDQQFKDFQVQLEKYLGVRK